MPVNTKGLSLAARKDIRDEFTNKLPALKKTLKDITGHDYEFSVDFATIHADAVKADEERNDYYTKNLGSIAFRYFESIVRNIKRVTEKDELVRESFTKLTEKREFLLVTDADLADYNSIDVTDGCIYIKTRPNAFGTNSDVGYYIVNQLKDTTEVLPVQTKKNIRDEWEVNVPSLKKTIKEALTQDYDFVIDFDDIYSQAIKANEDQHDYYTANLGSIVYRYYESLLGNIKRVAQKDEVIREEIVKLTETRKIHFVIDPELEDYNAIEVTDGAIYIKVKPTAVGTNSSIGYYIVNEFKDPNGALSLRAKVNIRDEWELKIPALKKQLKKALGEDYQFEVDFEDIYTQAVKENEDQTDYYDSNLGSITFRYFESLVQNIERVTKNDELVRQEFLNLTSARKFVLEHDPVLLEEINEYNDIQFENGISYIKTHPKSYGTNSSIGYYIIQKLHHPDSVLPLVAKKNIRDEWEKKNPTLKKKLKQAVGEDYEFKVDFEDLYLTAVKNGQGDEQWLKQSLGEVVFGYYEALVSNIVKVTKDDELVREGFLEATENKEIHLLHDAELENDYHDIQVNDGNLTIRIQPGKFGTNRNSVGYNIIDVL
ncbi:7533_t:CDS:2 [Ambispora gerdemannii]|uniref:7533_t:CDS:1 n=1 Tax=Ambispora gerdemannii TaxID=144530 RepID=A0A9N8ZQ70_9GLOM|nr:7533_t:CDS:2 [Ambispora gerdemannii]